MTRDDQDARPEDAGLLRPAEVAELFGVRVPTVARWAREGRLGFVLTPGGHRRYLRADLRAAPAGPRGCTLITAS
jgi:excisionase family DNA binding protein